MEKGTAYIAHPWVTRGTPEEAKVIEIAISKGYNIYEPFEKEDGLEKKYGGKYYELPMKVKVEFAKDIVRTDLARVVLPHPDSPAMPNISFSPSVKLTPLTALTSPIGVL